MSHVQSGDLRTIRRYSDRVNLAAVAKYTVSCRIEYGLAAWYLERWYHKTNATDWSAFNLLLLDLRTYFPNGSEPGLI